MLKVTFRLYVAIMSNYDNSWKTSTFQLRFECAKAYLDSDRRKTIYTD